MSEEQAAQNNTTITNCRWCGGTHGIKCPIVKAFEFHPDGTIRRVEFYAPNEYGPLSAVSLYPNGPAPWPPLTIPTGPAGTGALERADAR